MSLLRIEDVLPYPDGTYSVTHHPGGVIELVDYAARWSFGYIVGVKTLEFSDIKPGNLVGIWTNPQGIKEYDVVKHVDALQDAVKLGRDHDQYSIWDLRFERELKL